MGVASRDGDYLIQLLLPLHDNSGNAFPSELYAAVRRELTEQFGGLTAFTRAPAEGLWKDEGDTVHDEIVVIEVMTPELDAAWWRSYRRGLERRFRQDSIVIRAQEVTML